MKGTKGRRPLELLRDAGVAGARGCRWCHGGTEVEVLTQFDIKLNFR